MEQENEISKDDYKIIYHHDSAQTITDWIVGSVKEKDKQEKQETTKLLIGPNRQIKGATIEKLIEKATDKQYTEIHKYFAKSVAISFVSISKPIPFFELLIKRYKAVKAIEIQTKVIELIKEWVAFHPQHFINKDLKKEIEKYVSTAKDTILTKELRQILSKLASPTPAIPELFKGTKELTSSILDLDTKELADQLVYLEYLHQKAIPLEELVLAKWEDDQKKKSSNLTLSNSPQKQAPNIERYIFWCDNLTYWICTETLTTKGESAQKAKILAKFLEVAQHAFGMSSFATAMQIYLAVNNFKEVEAIWSYIPEQQIKFFDLLGKLFDYRQNYKIYRTTLSRSKTPCLPKMTLLIRDLTIVTTLNSKFVEFSKKQDLNKEFDHKFVNVHRFDLLGKIIGPYLEYLSKPFSPPKKLTTLDYLMAAETWSEEEVKRVIKDFKNRDKLSMSSFISVSMTLSPRNLNLLARRKSPFMSPRSEIEVKEEMSEHDWALIFAGGDSQSFEEGEILLDSNEDSIFFQKITNGEAQILLKYEDNRTEAIAKLGPNSVFGESCLFPEIQLETCNLLIKATQKGELKAVGVEYINSLLATDAGLALRFYKFLASREFSKLKRFNFLDQKNVKKAMEISDITSKVSSSEQNEDNYVKVMFMLETPEKVIKKFLEVSFKFAFSFHKGTLYVTEKNLLFKSLESNEKIAIFPISKIVRLKKKETGFSIYLLSSKNKETREKFRCDESVYEFVKELIENRSNTSLRKSSRMGSLSARAPIIRNSDAKKDGRNDYSKDLSFSQELSIEEEQTIGDLTSEDWQLLLSATNKLTCEKGDVLIEKDYLSKKLFLLVSGECAAVKASGEDNIDTLENYDKEAKELYKIKEHEIFGEAGFLRNEVAAASVVVSSPTAEIQVMRSHFLFVLFSVRPALGAKFYRYLSRTIFCRLNSKIVSKFKTVINPSVKSGVKRLNQNRLCTFQQKIHESMKQMDLGNLLVTKNKVAKSNGNAEDFKNTLNAVLKQALELQNN